MDPRTMKAFSARLVEGGLLAAIGASAGFWLPYELTLAAVAAVGARILVLEARIVRACAAQAAAPRLRDPGDLRIEAHALGALLWGLAAGVILTGGVALTHAAGFVALVLALRQADYLALCSAVRAEGRPLPLRLVVPDTTLATGPRAPD